MTREINRRLLMLERALTGDRLRYTISDRTLSDEEWRASLEGDMTDEDEQLSPIMSEAEWVATYWMMNGSQA
jgi:hypothetical protein